MPSNDHIFISYSRLDGNLYADKLQYALEVKGYKIWRDVRNINPSHDFTADIERGIENASLVLVCITEDAKSATSFVRREIQYAIALRKPVIPLRFKDVIPHVSIINNEWINFFGDWEAAFIRLQDIINNEGHNFILASNSSDPYRLYLETLFKQLVHFLDQTVFSLITLSLDATPDAIETSSQKEVQALPLAFFDYHGAHYPAFSVEIPKDEIIEFSDFSEAFEKYNGRVLLLGDPGTGKTTTLMSYARDAVSARLHDPAFPVPIVAHIARWDFEKYTTLTAWLQDEIPALKEQIAGLIENGQALILLDGLDELGEIREKIGGIDSQQITSQSYSVNKRYKQRNLRGKYRAGSYRITKPTILDYLLKDEDDTYSINMEKLPSKSETVGSLKSNPKEVYDPRSKFIDIIPKNNRIVITCRIEEYANIGKQLSLNGAVALRKLSDLQIRSYLNKMPDLWNILQNDNELREVSRTPLLLSLFSFAYQGLTNKAISLHDLSGVELRNTIFAQYVQRRYEHEQRKPYATISYTFESLMNILGHIAMLDFNSQHIGENSISDEIFMRTLQQNELEGFFEFTTRLHLLVITTTHQSNSRNVRFLHLLMRDFFAYTFSKNAIRNNDIDIRFNALLVLDRLNDIQSAEAISTLLGDPASYIAENALQRLKKLGNEGEKWIGQGITKMVSINTFIIKNRALNMISTLDNINYAYFSELFSLLVHDKDRRIRSKVAQILGEIANPLSVPLLVLLLSDNGSDRDNRKVCDYAADALKKIDTLEATTALEEWKLKYKH